MALIKLFVKMIGPDYRLGRMITKMRMLAQMLPLRLARPADDDIRDLLKICQRVIPRYSMVSVDRLRSLYIRSIELARQQIPGANVECGTWNGGAAAVISHASIRGGMARDIWLFDSFEGLPAPTADDPPEVHKAYHAGWCTGSPEKVIAILTAEGTKAQQIHIVKGWFEDTLPAANVGPIALLHVDSDWYESVRICLDAFFDSVVPGGLIIIDDYNLWGGCRKAVDEFFEARGMVHLLLPSGRTAVYLTKPDHTPRTTQ
jgi:hypothetical protein